MRIMAVRINRRGLNNNAQKPKNKRSNVRRLGARRRARCRTRSCCFRRIFSASTVRIPQGPKTTDSLASRCVNNTIAFPIGNQLEPHWTPRQESRLSLRGSSNYEFAMYRRFRRWNVSWGTQRLRFLDPVGGRGSRVFSTSAKLSSTSPRDIDPTSGALALAFAA